ncbi:glycosyltransferase family 9 protein [Quadrisphaera sp. DSM 44207]|uniref:glycosyltransferase family 9 protein n=1 Tax=Quadrisphaera sp. DSM 44207 TaxID=1881057 RepID=UPI000885B13A|nr:glycosyltransferase family 9 protein [Quadrisphaera sp. DSM 44207]SDQ83946.1 ADP-heptose:LPS heptosyltransferase [Quadrisphaera sp. DSM 44207]
MSAPGALGDPVLADPVLADPVLADPVLADPVLADPVLADHVLADPVLADPVLADHVLADPVLADPAVRSVALLRLRTGMGDLLCTVPALRALRRARPDVRTTLVTWAEMRPVVERMGAYVDELLDFPGRAGIPERPPRPERWDAWVADARARRFDLALQVYGANPVANAVTAAVGARRTGGFFATTALGSPELPGLVDLSTHVPYPAHLHEVDRHLHLFAALGVPGAGRHLELSVGPRDEAEAGAVRAGAALAPGRYVALHAGATCSSRRWPPARFAEVAAGLVAAGWRVALTGVPAEQPVVDAVLAALPPALATASGPGVVDVCGRTGLGGFAALLRGAALLLSNDTGAAHVASALAVPSVVVFLSGDPRRWAAPDASRHRVARHQVECSPCPHLDCPIDFRCATRLAPSAVLGECLELLGSESSDGLRARRPRG